MPFVDFLFETHDEDVWICDACGDGHEEGLAIYEIIRVTRAYPVSRCVCLCADCAERVPHGRVIIYFTNNGTTSSHDRTFQRHVSEIDLKYVNMVPGQCLLFHKNLLHMSDPRGKKNQRVAVQSKHDPGTLTVKNVPSDNYLTFVNPRLHSLVKQIPRHLKEKNFKVGLFDLA